MTGDQWWRLRRLGEVRSKEKRVYGAGRQVSVEGRGAVQGRLDQLGEGEGTLGRR